MSYVFFNRTNLLTQPPFHCFLRWKWSISVRRVCHWIRWVQQRFINAAFTIWYVCTYVYKCSFCVLHFVSRDFSTRMPVLLIELRIACQYYYTCISNSGPASFLKQERLSNRFTIQYFVKQVFRFLTSRPRQVRFHGRNWRQFSTDKKLPLLQRANTEGPKNSAYCIAI